MVSRNIIRARHLTYRLMQDRPVSIKGRVLSWGLIGLIILNVLAVIAESVDGLNTEFGWFFQTFDAVSVGVFTAEYLMRLWVCVDHPGLRYRHPVWGRLAWACSPMALIDLLSIAPFYLGLWFDLDLRALRVLRILRILKLSRYSLALTVIVDVIKKEKATVGAMLIILAVVLVFSGSLAYLAEHHAQPTVFRDIPSSMWWAVVTVTTLGYGDMVPITVPGKILGAVTAITGLGMIALPSGFLASGFSEELRIRREQYRLLVDDVLESSGGISAPQRHALDEARQALNLSEDEAIEILRAEVSGGHRVCPHCGKAHNEGA